MLRNLLVFYKWRKIRLDVWRKRLLHQLHLLSPPIPCSLHVHWAPYNGGSVIMDRKYKKAKIIIQIPYDRYVTNDDQQVMAQYNITTHSLPYFILFHEYHHLLEVVSLLKCCDTGAYTYFTENKKASRSSMNYRSLDFERRADEYAYQQYMDLRGKTG